MAAQSIDQKVVAAILVQHEPTTTPQVRQAALKFCDDLKANFGECLKVSLRLLGSASGEKADHIRMFALHCIEHIIVSGWNRLPAAEKAFLKEQALALLSAVHKIPGPALPPTAAGAAPTAGPPAKFIQEKVVKLVAEIAKREWPQHWTDMLEKLVKFTSLNELTLQLVILVFRNLGEEVTAFNPKLPEQRKKEIQTGLLACMDSLFPFIQNVFTTQLAKFKTNTKDAACRNLILSCLLTVQSFSEFLPAKYLFEKGAVPILCQMLSIPDLSVAACDVLCAAVSKKTDKIAPEFHPQLLGIWETSVTFMEQVQAAKAFEKQITFLHSGESLLAAAVKNHAKLAAHERYTPLRNKTLALLGKLLFHQSLKLSASVLEVWLFIFRSYANEFIHEKLRPTLVKELFQVTVVKMVKAKTAFDEKEHESDEDYNLAFSKFRGSLLMLARELVRAEAQTCLALTNARFKQLLASGATDSKNARGFSTVESVRYRELDAAATLLDCVVRNLPGGGGGGATGPGGAGTLTRELATGLEELCAALAAYKSPDALLQSLRLRALSFFAPLFKVSTTALRSTIDQLFQAISFRAPDEAKIAWEALSEDTRATRRRALFTLVVIAKKDPKMLFPYFNDLVKAVVAKEKSGTSDIADAEKTLLFEFLIHISNAMPDRNQQNTFVTQLLSASVQVWNSADYQTLTTAPAQFMKLFGFKDDSATRVMRAKVQHTLNTFLSVFRSVLHVGSANAAGGDSADGLQLLGLDGMMASGGGTPQKSPNKKSAAASAATAASTAPAVNAHLEFLDHPSTKSLASILPNTLRTIAVVHALWAPEVAKTLVPPTNGILAPSREHLAFTLGLGSAPKKNPKTNDPVAGIVYDVQNWLDHVRETSYSILALGTRIQQFYAQKPSDLVATVFAHVQSQDDRHLRLLLERFVVAFVRHCPPAQYTTLLRPLLQGLIVHVFQRLSTRWSKFEHQNESKRGSGGKSEIMDEIMEEKELRELTRSWCEMWMKVLGVSDGSASLAVESGSFTATGTAATTAFTEIPRSSSLAVFIIGDEALYRPLIMCLTACLCWPDSISCRRAAALCFRFVPIAAATASTAAATAASTAIPTSLFGATAAAPAASASPLHALFGDVLKATLRALSRVSAEAIDNSALDLVFLVKEIYARMGASSGIYRTILSSISGVDAGDVKLLDDTLASPTGVPTPVDSKLGAFASAMAAATVTALTNATANGDAKTAAAASGAADRKYRAAFRTFLTKYVIGVGLTATDKSTAIVNLPEALIASRQKLAKQSNTGFALDDTASHALMSLFK